MCVCVGVPLSNLSIYILFLLFQHTYPALRTPTQSTNNQQFSYSYTSSYPINNPITPTGTLLTTLGVRLGKPNLLILVVLLVLVPGPLAQPVLLVVRSQSRWKLITMVIVIIITITIVIVIVIVIIITLRLWVTICWWPEWGPVRWRRAQCGTYRQPFS